MFRAIAIGALGLLLGSFAQGSPALAGGAAQQSAVLAHAGEAVEVRGVRTRVIAFFEGAAGGMELTVLLSGAAFGTEVLRSRMPLSDGQQHALILTGGAGEGAIERVTFLRRGETVRIDLVTETADLAAAGAVAEPARAEPTQAAPDGLAAELRQVADL